MKEVTSITVKMSPEEKARLQEFAQYNQLTVSWVVRRAIEEYLNSFEVKEE